MKKVLSVLLAIAMVLSFSLVAFADDATTICKVTGNDLINAVASEKGVSADFLKGIMSGLGKLPAIGDTDLNAEMKSDDITTVLAALVGNSIITLDQAETVLNGFVNPAEGETQKLDAATKATIYANVQSKVSSGDYVPPTNTGNKDVDSFIEGAQSAFGKLSDSIKDAIGGSSSGSDALSGITDFFSGLFGGGSSTGSSSSSSSTTGSKTSGSSSSSSSSTKIPSTGDSAPIVSVAVLAGLAGVAFVLTRKKNHD